MRCPVFFSHFRTEPINESFESVISAWRLALKRSSECYVSGIKEASKNPIADIMVSKICHFAIKSFIFSYRSIGT
jgi:hypothetical protein